MALAWLTDQERADQAGLGIGMMLTAWLFFALTDTAVKWLVVLGIPALQLAFMRYAVHFALSCGVALAERRGFEPIPRRHLVLLLFRAFLLVSATVLNFIALKYLPLTVSSAIMFSAPIIVSALSAPLLAERVGLARWAAILVGFAGVLIVMRPFGAEFHWASLMVVYNAIAMALFSIITRQLAGAVRAQSMQFVMGVFGTLVLLPAAVFTWENPETLRDWILLFALGAAAWLGHEIFSRAHSLAEASVLMPFSYSFLVYLTITSFLVFGDLPDGATLIGAGLIVVSGLWVWWQEKRRRVVRD
ncbi:MAG: DMT family transporter [Pseudomonadota bacterium]